MVSWLDIRRLARDAEPALYVYHQTYLLAGKTLTRRMFFARLRLEPFGQGAVFAHEQTFGGPKEDRLKLMIATRCNLSPIFGMYPDATNDISAVLDEAVGGLTPDGAAQVESVQNQLWAVTDAATIERVQEMMKDNPIYIADGHHRYSTALNYQQLQKDRLGILMREDPCNYVMTVFCGMEDPGATIQPYFRTLVDLPELTVASLQAAIADSFTWTPGPLPKTPEDLAHRLSAAGAQALALYFARENTCVVIQPKQVDLLAKLEPKRHAAWRKLPYAIFHRYLVDEVIGPKFNGGKPTTIHYLKGMAEAVKDAQECRGVAALMPATSMAQLREVCAAGELMPQKSTYFFPKLLTGLVINPLY